MIRPGAHTRLSRSSAPWAASSSEILVDRVGVVGGGDLLAQAGQDGIEIGGAIGALDDGCDRHGRGAVPVSVEYPRQIADNRPDRQHIQIAKIGDGVHAIVVVADIAAADDRRRIVGHHQLVVHAAVDPAEVDKEVEPGPPPVAGRVEQTDLDIGVGVEGGFDRIAGLVVGIVDEEPHPDPAIGRPHHPVDDDPAGRIAVPDVVLHVETSLGQVGQRQAYDEGLARLAQEAEAGEARMRVGRRAKKLAQPRVSFEVSERRHLMRQSASRVPADRALKRKLHISLIPVDPVSSTRHPHVDAADQLMTELSQQAVATPGARRSSVTPAP